MENGSVSTLGIYDDSDGNSYTGISLSHITSSTIIQDSNRRTIDPIYLVAGFKPRWKLAPYIEIGADLPEMIIDEIFNNEDIAPSEIDFYYSCGLEYSATDRISFSLYAKKYKFIFRESSLAPITKIKPVSYGVGLIIRF